MSATPEARCCPEPALTPSDPPRGDLRQDHPLAPPSPCGTQPTPVSVEDDWGRVQDAAISVHDEHQPVSELHYRTLFHHAEISAKEQSG